MTKTVPVFITLTPSECCYCCSYRLAETENPHISLNSQGTGGGDTERQQANSTSADKAMLTKRLSFLFLRCFFFLLLKKRNSSICTNGKTSFIWPWKKLVHLLDACDKHVGKQTRLGSAGRKNTSYSALQVVNLRTHKLCFGKCNSHL